MQTENSNIQTNQTTQQNATEVVTNVFGAFGRSAETMAENIAEEERTGGGLTKFFELDPVNSPDKQDSAVVRLLPNFKNFSNDLVKKTSYKVSSPDGIFYFDSAKSLGWDHACVVGDNWRNVKDDVAKKTEWNRVFNYKKQVFGLVQIVEYAKDPKLVGQIMPIRINGDLEDIIQKALNPSDEDMKFNGAVAQPVFDVFTAPTLYLKAVVKNYGTGVGRDFSNSQFITVNDNYRFFQITNEEGQVVEKLSLTPEEVPVYMGDQSGWTPSIIAKLQKVLAFIQDKPSQEDQAYKPQSEDKVNKVTQLAQTILNGGTIAPPPPKNTGAQGTTAPQTTTAPQAQINPAQNVATQGVTQQNAPMQQGQPAPAQNVTTATVQADQIPNAQSILQQAGVTGNAGS